jgi:O-succinylbenzoic acid--CoA ligase
MQHSREAMTASASRTCDFFHLKQSDTALLALPSTHIGGKMMIVRSIIRGLKLICTEPRSNPLAQLDADIQIDFAAFTPMQMTLIMDDASTLPKLSKIKKIILGGGEVSDPLRQRLQGIDASVYETYGMTETISHIALKKLNGTDRSANFTTLEGVKIALDSRACLMIEAPHLTSSLLITNDIVRIVSDKEFHWLGRYDNIINTGGIKVSAEEIERKLQSYIKEPFFIAGIADQTFGQAVSIIIESSNFDKNSLDKYIALLDKYERPKHILTIDKFSYTENG